MTDARMPGDQTALVPMITRSIPHPSAATAWSALRMPPPSWIAIPRPATRRHRDGSGLPVLAPSRSITCSQAAPASFQASSWSPIDSPYLVTRP